MNPEHVKKIVALREKNKVPELLSEGKKRIIYICKGIDSLKVHTSMFIVLAMMVIGRILNEIYTSLGSNRSEYAKWVKAISAVIIADIFSRHVNLWRWVISRPNTAVLVKTVSCRLTASNIEAYKEIIRDHLLSGHIHRYEGKNIYRAHRCW